MDEFAQVMMMTFGPLDVTDLGLELCIYCQEPRDACRYRNFGIRTEAPTLVIPGCLHALWMAGVHFL